MSVLEVYGTWYQPRHVLVCSWVVRCYSLFVCHSEAELAFYFHVHFQILSLLLLVNIVVLLLRVSCFPLSSYDHQSLFVAPFLGCYSATIHRKVVYLYQSRRISTWHQRLHNIFPYTFYTPFLVSLPDCLVEAVLGRHVHPPTTTHKDIQHAINAIPVISSGSTGISRKRDWR